MQQHGTGHISFLRHRYGILLRTYRKSREIKDPVSLKKAFNLMLNSLQDMKDITGNYAADSAMKILEDAFAIQDAGCFMLEFEAVPAKIAKVISQQLEIPTIGIGAGVGCDGQILLGHDLLGVFTDFKPKFTKRYANLTEVALKGIGAYIADVKAGTFPDDDHSYGVDEKEYEKFLALVEKRKHR